MRQIILLKKHVIIMVIVSFAISVIIITQVVIMVREICGKKLRKKPNDGYICE